MSMHTSTVVPARHCFRMFSATRASSLFGACMPHVLHRITSTKTVLYSMLIQQSYTSIATRCIPTICRMNSYSLISPKRVMLPMVQTNIFGNVGLASRIFNLVNASALRMSSTLKKRRAKMNKHKLRKRRKLLRRKSKG